MKPERLVLIEWEDAIGCSSSWNSLDSCSPTVPICRSVGWLVYDGDDCKVIVPHIISECPGVEDQGCGEMTIPATAIRRVINLVDPLKEGLEVSES